MTCCLSHRSDSISASSAYDDAALELGVIFAGSLEAVDREAVLAAIESILERLQSWLPEFSWDLHAIDREDWNPENRVEPTELLQHAREQRDERGWDFTFVVTAADLVSHYKPFALAVISSALDAAILSTARVDPKATRPESSREERTTRMRDRVVRLMLHSLGHWVGLAHADDPRNAMFDIDSIEALPAACELDARQVETMRRSLEDIADQRLEEREDAGRSSLSRFYFLAAWENRSEIADALVQARPWQFPIRLSRLTTAAVSTVLVLLMTAETWDMAMSQSWATGVGLLAFSIAATTAYVATRQQLFLRRNGRRITEQIVTSNLSAAAIVAAGMLVMFLLLAVLTLVAATLLFPEKVVEGWAASLTAPIDGYHYGLMATIVGSLGILIGALGASFEQQHYFRHIVFVDEEV